MFHWKDGWFFNRADDGSVEIFHTTDGKEPRPRVEGSRDTNVFVHLTIPADNWASIIASVSAGDEVDGRFYAARDFHASIGPLTVHEPLTGYCR
jgi:hypothetical protein